ncbi:MAG: hypothetical protein GY870_05005 [archaeon]|nr:hypothetical protein [archaeon]
MRNLSSIKLELGIDATQIIHQVQIDNVLIENQIKKGIELALSDLTKEEKFVNIIRENTKKELASIVNSAVMKWEVRNKISKMVEKRIGDKIEEYADTIAEKMISGLS